MVVKFHGRFILQYNTSNIYSSHHTLQTFDIMTGYVINCMSYFLLLYKEGLEVMVLNATFNNI